MLLLLLCGAPLAVFSQNPLTLDDCFTFFRFYPEFGGDFKYAADSRYYWVASDGEIALYETATGVKNRVLLDKEALEGTGAIESFELNGDETSILLQTNVEHIYRHSVVADYWVYDLKRNKHFALNEGAKIQFAQFSPDGKQVVFILNNNIYVRNLESANTMRITDDGAINKVRNGLPDWLYEEEFSPVDGSGMQAIKWSPDSRMIAFIRFDESRIPAYKMNLYRGDMYPAQDSFKYPKVAQPNSEVRVQVYELSGRNMYQIEGLEQEDYVPRLNWTPSSELIITRLNRMQDTLELLQVLIDRPLPDELGKNRYLPLRLLLQETNKAYVELHDNLFFLADGQHYLWSSEQDGYNRLYQYSFDRQAEPSPKPLTPADVDMTAFYGVDEKNGKIYYQLASPSPLQRQVWESDLRSGKATEISAGPGTWDAKFSPDFNYYTLQWSDANTPPRITLNKRNGEKLRVLTDNSRVRSAMKNFGFKKKTFWSFRLPNGIELNGWMIRPDTLAAGKKYPVLFDVYGGPGSQTVQNQYDGYMMPWHQYLVQHGVIVVSVDNRGTGARGEAFKKCTQLQLGKLETEDQIAAARYLGSLPYIDPARIGIWGWSFGGYLSSSCLLKGNDVFKMAMAVAPVTNWKWYDSAYTERYMRTLTENEAGFENNSPVNFAHLLRGDYLICHGIADDNVHWQQTTEMINALIKANKPFETQYYPNRNHGIYGDNATMHLFTKLTGFVQKRLIGE